ncbi:RDD family protein [Mycobacterium botniense]|uniref:RDD family protein n=1 Tax=Mycobacterium botniense TaxID=84962 RepID=UPI0013D78558
MPCGNAARVPEPADRWPRPGRQPKRPVSAAGHGYRGQALGLPEAGRGALAGMGRRLSALAADWLVAYGLAGLGTALGVVPLALLDTAVLVFWFILGTVAVWLFGFTPGQFMLGLMVVCVDRPAPVRLGRAALRAALIATVIPALFVDADGRGLHDRLTGTAVLRR